MLCVFGGTHAKQHLSHQCQHTSLLSHGSQPSLPYPLSQCTSHSPLILTSACIYFLQFVPSIQKDYPSFRQNHHSPCFKSTLSVFIPKWTPSNHQILQYQHSDHYQASINIDGRLIATRIWHPDDIRGNVGGVSSGEHNSTQPILPQRECWLRRKQDPHSVCNGKFLLPGMFPLPGIPPSKESSCDLLKKDLVSGIAGSHDSSMFSFLGASILFSIESALIHTPTNGARGPPFLHTLFSIYCLWGFWWWPFWRHTLFSICCLWGFWWWPFWRHTFFSIYCLWGFWWWPFWLVWGNTLL